MRLQLLAVGAIGLCTTARATTAAWGGSRLVIEGDVWWSGDANTAIIHRDSLTLTVSQSNLGPLPTFSAASTCTDLTAYFKEIFNGDSTLPADVTSTILETIVQPAFPSITPPATLYTGPIEWNSFTEEVVERDTVLFGAGDAVSWYKSFVVKPYEELAQDAGYAQSPPAPEDFPLSACFPSNILGPVDSTTSSYDPNNWLIETYYYYSPAVSCPGGWEIAAQTTLTSSTTTRSGASSVVTETAAVCCRSGWQLNVQATACNLPAYGSTLIAKALVTTISGSVPGIVRTNLPVVVPTLDSLGLTKAPVEDLTIQIRWQNTDAAAASASAKASPMANTTSSTTRSSSGGAANASFMAQHYLFFISVLATISIALAF